MKIPFLMTFKLFAKKSLGQNFLVNPHLAQRIVEAADVSETDTILEVGPGTGMLTRELVSRAAKVIAVEKDRRVIENLKSAFPNAEIIENDILEFKPANHGLKTGDYKVVANLPYYITSHFIRTVLEEWPSPSLMVLMVQKEVAQRMLAKPPKMNLLALSVQYFSKPELVVKVSPGSFRPIPSVESAVVKLTPRASLQPQHITQKVFSVIRLGFSRKRKMLLGNLSTTYNRKGIINALTSMGLSEKIRAENLSLEEWVDLEKRLDI